MKRSFDKLTEAALNKILFVEYEHEDSFNLSVFENGQATIIVDSSEAYERRLIFSDARISEKFEVPSYYAGFYLTEQEEGYCLNFGPPYETESYEPFQLYFSTVKAEIECYNYTKFIVPYYDPWHLLAVYLYQIRNKREQLSMEYVNEEEKKLLALSDFIPLMQHFSAGFDDDIIYEAENNPHPEVLKNAADLFIWFTERAQLNEIEKLARLYAELPPDSKNRKAVNQKLQRALTSVGGEPLYRLILEEIRQAGGRYPDKIDTMGKRQNADQIRTQISFFFNAQGFEGAYPSFRKVSTFRGLRMIQMENPADVEFFWHKHNMASLIHCCEDCIDGELTVSYITSTVFLNKDQTNLIHRLSADSGFFKEKKKRRRGRVIINQRYWTHSGFATAEDEHLKAMELASRISQCEKITRAEREEYFASYSNGILAFVSVVFGLLFGAIMCTAIVLLAIAVGWFVDGSLPLEFFLGIPWHRYFLFCSVSSGLALFLIVSVGGRRG